MVSPSYLRCHRTFDEIVLLSSDNTPSTSADKEPFRLSSNERKKIRRGLQASKLGQTSQTKVKFRVQAAASSRKQTPNYLIYIGKLAKDTTIPSLREHLLNIGVPNEDLADILDLNCRINNECSFCLSVQSAEAKSTISDPLNWPAGVRIRPYTEKSALTRSPGHRNKPSHRYTRQLPSTRHSNNMRYEPRPNRKSRKYVHKQSSLAYLPSDADYRDNFYDSRYFVSNSKNPCDRNYSLCNDRYRQHDSRYVDCYWHDKESY